MRAVLHRFPIRCALLALTLIALTVVMWNAWRFGGILAVSFIMQAVNLAKANGGLISKDCSPRRIGFERLQA